jgi:hypothetical protein
LQSKALHKESRRRKALGKYTAEKLDDEMFERTSKKLEDIDLLKNSELPKGHLIRDVFRYGCQSIEKRLDPSLALPRRTLECYY